MSEDQFTKLFKYMEKRFLTLSMSSLGIYVRIKIDIKGVIGELSAQVRDLSQ